MTRRIRIGVAVAALLLVGSTAFAAKWFPGSWKVTDSGKAIRKPSGNLRVARITNNGPDAIWVSSKGTLGIVEGPIAAGKKGAIKIPEGGKNVKIVDGNFGNSMGAKGSLIWAKKLPKTGGFGGGGAGGQ